MKIIVIPDTQVKEGVPLDHLTGLGNYIVDKRPDCVVHLGDHFDMPSLGRHNSKGHIVYEGARMLSDLEAGWNGMDTLLSPLLSLNNQRLRNKKAVYKPRKVFCYGNHENRRDRLLEQEPFLQGALSGYQLNQRYGWEEHDFLHPVKIGGINFVHYAQGGLMGRPISRAHLIAVKKHESYVCGHQQVLDIYYSPHVKTDGSRVQCVIAGSCYQHEEDYMGPQANQHWRGALMLTEVKNGSFDLVTLSLNYLIKEWT